MQHPGTPQYLEAFIHAYIVCALWSSTDGETPLDENYDREDLSTEALSAIREACEDFIGSNAPALRECGLSAEQAGHDFWLTRNHHGAGFWDRGIGDLGETLTDASQAYGSCDLYPGDDGFLYLG